MYTRRRWWRPAKINNRYEMEEALEDIAKELSEIEDVISTLRTFKRKGNSGYIRLLADQADQLRYVQRVTLNSLATLDNMENM